jgi:hypothetical protein
MTTDPFERARAVAEAVTGQPAKLEQITSRELEINAPEPTETVHALTNELLAAQAQRDLMLITLSQLRGDLRKLADANVDAPNVWRWTVQRMAKRLEAYTGALDHLEQRADTGPEGPSQPPEPA